MVLDLLITASARCRTVSVPADREAAAVIFGLTFLAAVDLLMIFVTAAVVYTIREDKKEFVRLHREIWQKFTEIEVKLDALENSTAQQIDSMNMRILDMRTLMGEYGTLTKNNNASIEELFRLLH